MNKRQYKKKHSCIKYFVKSFNNINKTNLLYKEVLNYSNHHRGISCIQSIYSICDYIYTKKIASKIPALTNHIINLEKKYHYFPTLKCKTECIKQLIGIYKKNK